jgi:hypothetical protein
MSTPIFILGNPRSGSSTVLSCLRILLGIQGYNEGHFLKYIDRYKKLTNEIFDKLTESEKNKEIAMGNIDKKLFINNILHSFKNTYESLFDNSQKYWIDKTPDSNLQEIKQILYLWPDSKFIMLKRRSLENIKSRVIKFPHLDFKNHCEEWNHIMQNWYYLDKKLLKNFIEIEHYDMLFNIEKVAKDITCLLPEYKDEEEQIINFFQRDYSQSTTGKKPSISDIDTINWTDEQKETHNKICLETLQLYGYSCDKNYFLSTTSPK